MRTQTIVKHQDIPDSTVHPIEIPLPAGGVLIGAGVVPLGVCPRTTAVMYVNVVEAEPRGSYLGKGVAWAVDAGGTNPLPIPYAWHGRLGLDEGFAHRLIVHIQNRTGATVRWLAVAVVEAKK